jgi:hypothetical protein
MWQQRFDEVHNYAGTLETTDAANLLSNIKIIGQNLLYNYFNSQNIDFVKRDPTIRKFLTNPQFEIKVREIEEPITIVREFPVQSRKFPFIMVSLGAEFKEKKLYLGWDNLAFYAEHIASNGVKLGEITEAATYTGKLKINLAAKSIDDRDKLLSYCGYGFQNYFRSNYRWIHPDEKSIFFFHLGSQEVEFEVDPNPIKDGTAGGDIFLVYTGGVNINFFLEHNYRHISGDLIDRYTYSIKGEVVPFYPTSKINIEL